MKRFKRRRLGRGGGPVSRVSVRAFLGALASRLAGERGVFEEMGRLSVEGRMGFGPTPVDWGSLDLTKG